MFLHKNEFLIWRNGKDETVIAKFRILGEVQRENGSIRHMAQSEFWDTSQCTDLTRRVQVAVQFQFIGIEPEDLAACKVDVSTSNGSRAYCLKFRDGNDCMLEYRSPYPMDVRVENNLYNKRTLFRAHWDRRPHSTLNNEFIFRLCVEKRDESMRFQPIVLTDNDDGHGKQPSIAKDAETQDSKDPAGEQLDHGRAKNGGRRPKGHHAEAPPIN